MKNKCISEQQDSGTARHGTRGLGDISPLATCALPLPQFLARGRPVRVRVCVRRARARRRGRAGPLDRTQHAAMINSNL